MSDFMNLMIAGFGGALASRRMAYTLGRKQPVLCTILGNDPHFFDIDPNAVADHLDDILSMDDTDAAPFESLRLARATSEGFVTLGDGDDGLPLTDDIAALCRDALQPAARLSVDDAVALLQFSSTGTVLRDQAAAMGIVIRGDDHVQGVRFDPEHNLVLINTHLSAERAALMLCREIRRAQLTAVTGSLMMPESAILLNRALQAELVTLPVQVAWELFLAGHPAAWEMVSTSALADLAYAFAHRASTDFRALRDGRAQMAAFDQWFYSGRTRKADRVLIQGLLAMSDAIAQGPMGNPQHTIDTLRMIGARGIGRNYLLDHMMMLTNDGFYGDVRDRSNANFLWFVKFERSYRAAEAQIDEQNKATGTHDNNAHHGAVILHFPDLFTKQGRKSRRSAKSS